MYVVCAPGWGTHTHRHTMTVLTYVICMVCIILFLEHVIAVVIVALHIISQFFQPSNVSVAVETPLITNLCVNLKVLGVCVVILSNARLFT